MTSLRHLADFGFRRLATALGVCLCLCASTWSPSAYADYRAKAPSTDIRGTMCVPSKTFKAGSIAYRLDTMTRPKRVGFRREAIGPSNGTTFLLVEYSVKNTAKKPGYGHHDPLKIRDGRDRVHFESGLATKLYALTQDMTVARGKLVPGREYRQAAVFQLPIDALRSGGLTLTIPGLTKGKTEPIDIVLPCVPSL